MDTRDAGVRLQFFLSGLQDLRHELKLTWSMAGNMFTNPQLRVTQAGNRADRHRLLDRQAVLASRGVARRGGDA